MMAQNDRRVGSIRRLGRPDNAQILPPWADGIGVLATQTTRDLKNVIQVVRHPGRKMLAEGHSPELRMSSRAVKIGRCESQASKPLKALHAKRTERIQ